jgi:hypothetical protein
VDAAISTPATAIFLMLLRMPDDIVQVIDHSPHRVDRSAGLVRRAEPAAFSLDQIAYKVPLFFLLIPFIVWAHGVAIEPTYRRGSHR